MHSELAALWRWFADTSFGPYSPLYDSICRAVADSDDVLELVAQAPPSGQLPTVLLAAVHDLLLRGLEHPLAAVYDGSSQQDAAPLFLDVCRTRPDELLELLSTRHTNTNEVGRSALLGPALTVVAERVGAPLALVDVGCSAGLNLRCDRYLLDYGPHGTTGPLDAPVRLACEVLAGDPPIRPRLPAIATRLGIDSDPVDVRDDDEARWLLACVWPDTGRLPRTRRAIEELRHDPPELVAGDAVDAIGAALRGLPPDATACVVTSWAFAYLPVDRRRAFEEALESVGRERPVAWVSGEGVGVVPHLEGVVAPTVEGPEPSVLGLVVFDAGQTAAEVLAVVHPHGLWLDWRA